MFKLVDKVKTTVLGDYMYDYKGVPVYSNANAMEVNGIVFGAAIKLFGGKRIWVDENFKMMEENSQKFILEHEIGHIINGDLDVSTKKIKQLHAERILAATTGTVHASEIAADKYAVENIGHSNVIEALQEIKEMMWIFAGEEIDLRIEAVAESM